VGECRSGTTATGEDAVTDTAMADAVAGRVTAGGVPGDLLWGRVASCARPAGA
jgi:hypothetical protein